jgi:predicted RNA-binding protein
MVTEKRIIFQDIMGNKKITPRHTTGGDLNEKT